MRWIRRQWYLLRADVINWWSFRFVMIGFAVVSLDRDIVVAYFRTKDEAKAYVSDCYLVDHVVEPNRETEYRIMTAIIPRAMTRRKYVSR